MKNIDRFPSTKDALEEYNKGGTRYGKSRPLRSAEQLRCRNGDSRPCVYRFLQSPYDEGGAK